MSIYSAKGQCACCGSHPLLVCLTIVDLVACSTFTVSRRSNWSKRYLILYKIMFFPRFHSVRRA